MGDFEQDRPARLLLDRGATFANPAAGGDIIDLQSDDVAAPELAVDRKVEQREVAFAALQLKPDPNCPDIFRLERALLARSGGPCSRERSWNALMMGSRCAWVVSLIPTAPPACADEAANQIYPNARFRSEFGRSCSCAAVVTSAESGPPQSIWHRLPECRERPPRGGTHDNRC